MTSRPKAGRTPVRRQAESNYLDVDQETALHRLESFHAAARGPFELLQSKFGFQTSSVANQKENLGCWITNYQMRIRAESLEGATESSDFVTRTALRRVHNKFFKNYLMWCKFLRTPPRACDTEKDTTLKMEKELALFLLLWGEAGNLRFMPECICFLYHSMAAKLEYLETLPDVEEGFYLDKIVRPMYYVIAKMRSATAPPDKRPLDHQDTTNYDDVNEFFWTPKCLACDERNVAKLLEVHDPKTFKEKRSVFNPILAFFRVWYFLVVVFHVMVVITYVAYMAEGDNDGGLGFFFRIFTTNQNKIRAHALYSIFMTVTGLLAMKVVLQIWLFGLRLYTDVWMAVGVFCRLIWHTLFFGLFVAIHFSPDGSAVLGSWSTILPGGGTAGSFLSMGLLYLAVYSIPVLLAALIRAFFPNAIWGIRIVSALDGTSRLYVGRHTAQPWKHYSRYSLSWFLIFLCKFLFALQFMIRPLMPPSIEIYDLSVNDNGVFKSGHNILFIAALWAPVVVVYLYDTQIWFIIYQSLIGLIMGKRMRIGHYVGLAQLKQGMARAPHLFDEKVVSQKTRQPHREERAPGTGDPTDAGDFRHRDVVRLRFAIIWNQVVENFRLNDLVDDREVMILQYRIIHHGDRVQEPIFLLAGKLAKGIEIASKARGHKWDTSTVIKQLATADALEGVRDGAELVRELFYLLLDEPDSDEPSGQRVLEYIYSSPDVVSLVDCTLLPTLADKVVEFLAAILDMPEDFSTLASLSDMPPELGMEVHVQVAQVVERVRDIACTLENMIHDDAVATKLHACRFLHATPDLAFQTQLLFALYQADAAAETGLIAVHRHDLARPPASATSRPFAPHDFLSSCTRLFFLLRLEVASSLPRCEDAKRRMGFFLHSLAMDMPRVPAMDAMPSFSVLTPYYSETVLFSLDELNNPVHANPLFSALEQKQKAKGWTELTIMKYLITFHAEEWSNFLERMGVASLDDALDAYPMDVRLWASMRGQTLARTVHGMMLYEDAIRLLRWLEVYARSDLTLDAKLAEMNRISALKFSYITGCQIYSKQVANGDPRAADIDYLMKKFPSWRVSFVDALPDDRFDCVLVKAEDGEIVEVYRYELPGNPILGEGKPENQNVALPFTRGEYLQTIDMNQEHYLEECLKMPNFLATATSAGEEVTVLGMKEHVFTGRASSLARFMTLQELVFVTLTQRVLAKPLRSRMHYGHPDVFEKSFVVTSGGVSKASKGINLSEDVFSGYNVTLRGGIVSHIEFIQCGKGRDVTLSQINAFEAKLSNGCAESCLSREGHRLTHALDFPRLNSMFYGHFGFYICNALTVLCVYVYAYCKLYIATHTEVQVLAISSSGSLDALASVLTTQYLLQFGMLTTLPLFATLFVEFGLKQALLKVLELLSTLGIVFYVFLTGTKAHFYDVALLRGGSKYRGTGRGFSITRDPMVNFFKEYGVSHFRKAVELIGVMILFGIYGTFDLGSGALAAYCKTATFDCDTHPDQIPARITALAAYSRQSQSFGLAAFAVLFLGACWLLAPFIFNTDGLVWQKTKVDIAHWFTWMMRSRDQADERSGEDAEPAKRDVVSDGWDDWWQSDVELMVPLGWMGRLTYCLREVRHPLAMYYIFLTEFTLPWFALLAAAMGVTWIVLWSGARVRHCVSSHDRRLRSGAVLGLLYMVTVVGGIFVVPLIAGVVCGWSVLKCFTFSVAMLLGFSALVQYALALHGAWGTRLATSGPIVALGFLLDMIVGLFLVVPLFLLSLLPFMRILQTRAMYNGGFSRALSSGSEVAASLCILLGLLAGFVHGFVTSFVATLGFINDSRDAFFNRSFYYFVTTALPQDGDEMVSYMKKGYIQATGAGMSIVAVVLSLGIGRVLGRRWNMALGATLVLVSLGLNFVSHTYVLLVSFGLAAMGAAMLAMNYLLYSYEICTKGWRGKSVTIFLLGSMLGWCIFSLIMANANATTISANFKNEPTSTWRVQPLFFVPALVLGLFGILWFVPESPVWLLAHQRDDAAQAVLVRLRRRQNVAPELALVHAELKQSTRKQHVVFRLSLVFALQATFGLVMSHAILVRRPLQLTDASRGAANNYWQVYFALCCATGFAFGSFLVDNVRRKTILKEFLPFVALVAFTCGIVAAVSEADGSLVQALLCLLYISAGLSLMSVTWLAALEMFPASRRPLYWTLSLSVYYGVELLVYLLKPSFALASFVLAGACGLLTVVLFVFCASTKLGAIQTKSEKKFQRSRPDTEREDAHRTTAQDVVVDDVHEQQRRIAQSATRSAGGAYNPVSSAIHVDGGGSARGKTRGPPLSRQDRAAPRDESGADKTTGECSFRRLESLDEDAAPEDVAPAAPPRALQYGLSTGLSQSHVSSGEVASNTQRSARQGLLPSHLSSTFDFEAEFEEEHLEELRQGQISYPRGQPRSVSFLQSREYPDAQVHAETRARRL